MAEYADTHKQEAYYKFHLYFTALMFTMLSFALQFPIETKQICINILQATSWCFLLIASLISLYRIKREVELLNAHDCLSCITWCMFILALILQIVARIWYLFI